MSIFRSSAVISEERLQFLLSKRMKASVVRRARGLGITIGEYVRRLIEADLDESGNGDGSNRFPFGTNPIRTGRRRGSVDHDRP
jgi:hypothetical protein